MATKTWTWEANFVIDADAGQTYRTTFVLDGHEYEINISPAQKMRQLRGEMPHTGLAGAPVEKTSMSLGPRGGCDCCGR